MQSRESKLLVYGSALLFSFIVGFSFFGFKTAVLVAGPLQTLIYRFNFAFLGILIFYFFQKDRVSLRKAPKRKLLMNAVFYLGFMALQAIGLRFATSIESGIIFAMIPILVKIVASIWLGERGDSRQNLFVTISVSGVILMFILGAGDYSGFNLFGLMLLFLSSLSMAVSNVAMRYVRKQCSPTQLSLVIAGGGFLAFNFVAIIAGLLGGNLQEYYLAPLSHPEFLLATAYLGILSTVISSMLMAYMIANLETVKATIFGNLSTAISLVAGAIFLGEPLRAYHVICTIMIIAGVLGTSMTGSTKIKKADSYDAPGFNREPDAKKR